MTPIELISVIVLALLLVECFFFCLINYLKKDFQWLLTKADDRPNFSKEVIDKFFANSFDPELGWVRKKNSSGFDKGKNGPVKYSIDDLGSRQLSAEDDNSAPMVASFGDSYTFCRQVENHQTWQAVMSAQLNSHVLNFGVGNYGLDQGLIRYNSTQLPDSVTTVIMGVVPETICRVHSYWKHYLEFGNTLAFKPRYKLENGQMVFLPNIIKSEDDLYDLSEHLNKVQENDEFYLKKYRSHQFSLPYSVSFFKHPKHNVSLVYYILKRKLYRLFGIANAKVENAPFGVIMKNNITESHKMYEQKQYCDLLKMLVTKFKEDAVSKGHRPILVIMPQLMDLKFFENRNIPYDDFYQSLKQELEVLDLTQSLLGEDYSQFYINDQYGGHFSDKGNLFVAEKILQQIKLG